MQQPPDYEAQPLMAIGETETPTNTAGEECVATLTASTTGGRHVLDSIDYGYSATPDAGELLVITDSTTTITVPVTEGGHQTFVFAHPFAFAVETEVTVTLSASAGESAYVNVQYR